jgi:hypothetical protein
MFYPKSQYKFSDLPLGITMGITLHMAGFIIHVWVLPKNPCSP